MLLTHVLLMHSCLQLLTINGFENYVFITHVITNLSLYVCFFVFKRILIRFIFIAITVCKVREDGELALRLQKEEGIYCFFNF